MDRLRIFGCLVYIHVPKEKRKNLDPTSTKEIFVGYSALSKAYIIYINEVLQVNNCHICHSP